jgi:lipopolysaccharide export system permease protein
MNIRRHNAPRFFRCYARRILLVLALAVAGAGLCALLAPIERNAVEQHILGFPDSDIQSQHARPLVLMALCFLPALAAFVYSFGGTLDRYITRRFLGMFAICLCALFAIWLLIDLTDNMSDFRESDHVWRTVFVFYGTRLPAVLLLLLPYSLLLALLESLGKLSTQREVIAMIQSGRGVLRITSPLIVAGLFCTLLTLGLNYHWAPTAEGRQDEILAEATGEEATEASKVLYRNRETRRLWMISAFPPDYEKGRPLVGVEVTTTGPDQLLKSRLSASHARWNVETRQWTFDDPVIARYQAGEPPVFTKSKAPLTINSWSETPWQIIKPGLSAEYLGIPELNAWLRTHALFPHSADPSPYLTHWHYRWALPFACLVTVLLATPLAIHFSRRGAGGGVFLAVVLSALMLLVNTIILAFGEAGALPPAVAAWLPNSMFALIGIYLYRRRITGQPIYHTLRRIFMPD